MPIGNNYSPEQSIAGETIGGFIKMSPITWRRELDFIGPEIVTDVFLLNKKFMKKNFLSHSSIGLILEPLEYLKISPRKMVKYSANLSKVLTFEDSLLRSRNEKYVPYYVGGSMLKLEEKLKFNEKRNRISFVLSSKRITSGHKYRHKIASTLGQKFNLTLYGSGINNFNERHIPFSSFQYSVVVENGKNSHLFTEKLIDCLLHKTVPIYWGGSKVLEIFDPRGILVFDSIKELNEILTNIKEEKIIPNKEAIEENQIIAFNFISKELNIYQSLTKIGFLPNIEFHARDYLTDFKAFLAGDYNLAQVLK
jgi:hypothetical protein